MNEPLDEAYLTWLYGQVASTRTRVPSRTYWNLCRQLYKKEFVWLIANDDNRMEDGRDLRHEFVAEAGIDWVDQDWLCLGCSMLEMMIGLSRRLSFVGDGEPRDWFWKLVDNLGILTNDRQYNEQDQEGIDEALDEVIWRTYRPSGQGGFFPLHNATQDQRRIELWYQLNAYLMENE